jgi:glutathione S-transferase
MEAATAQERTAGKGLADPPVLYHLEISHYNEKVRWALDYKGIPHVRKTPPPMMHIGWSFVMTRGKAYTFPVLKLKGKPIGDSTRIIEALERDYPEPALYPSDPQERQRALELEDFFDEELGEYIRRFLFHYSLEEMEPAEFIDGAMGSTPGAIKAVMRATAPVGKRMLRLRYRINAEDADAARKKTEAALDRLEAELQPSGYLVGEGFSVADLTAAALFFPVVRPPEAPHRVPEMPPTYTRFRDSVSERPGFRWVQEMYRRHRGSSAAIAR